MLRLVRKYLNKCYHFSRFVSVFQLDALWPSQVKKLTRKLRQLRIRFRGYWILWIDHEWAIPFDIRKVECVNFDAEGLVLKPSTWRTKTIEREERNARTRRNNVTRAITHGRHETIILYKAGHSFKRETDSSFSLLFYIIIQKFQIFRYCFQFSKTTRAWFCFSDTISVVSLDKRAATAAVAAASVIEEDTQNRTQNSLFSLSNYLMKHFLICFQSIVRETMKIVVVFITNFNRVRFLLFFIWKN